MPPETPTPETPEHAPPAREALSKEIMEMVASVTNRADFMSLVPTILPNATQPQREQIAAVGADIFRREAGTVPAGQSRFDLSGNQWNRNGNMWTNGDGLEWNHELMDRMTLATVIPAVEERRANPGGGPDEVVEVRPAQVTPYQTYIAQRMEMYRFAIFVRSIDPTDAARFQPDAAMHLRNTVDNIAESIRRAEATGDFNMLALLQHVAWESMSTPDLPASEREQFLTLLREVGAAFERHPESMAKFVRSSREALVKTAAAQTRRERSPVDVLTRHLTNNRLPPPRQGGNEDPAHRENAASEFDARLNLIQHITGAPVEGLTSLAPGVWEYRDATLGQWEVQLSSQRSDYVHLTRIRERGAQPMTAAEAPPGQVRADIAGNRWRKSDTTADANRWIPLPPNPGEPQPTRPPTPLDDAGMDERTWDIEPPADNPLDASVERIGARRLDAQGSQWTKESTNVWRSPQHPNLRWTDGTMTSNTRSLLAFHEMEEHFMPVEDFLTMVEDGRLHEGIERLATRDHDESTMLTNFRTLLNYDETGNGRYRYRGVDGRETEWVVESLDREASDDEFLALRCVTDDQLIITLPRAEVAASFANGREGVNKLIAEALRNREGEVKNRAALEQFNLPDSLNCIRVAPRTYDPVMGMASPVMHMLPEALRRLPDSRGRANSRTVLTHDIIYSDDPIAGIEEQIRTGLAQQPPVRDCFLTLFNHGSPEAVEFTRNIDADILEHLMDSYPEVRLHTDTIACFGGGLHNALQTRMNERGEDGQLTARAIKLRTQFPMVATQSTGQSVNRAGQNGSLYHLAVLDGIMSGRSRTWGQAIIEGDRAGRAYHTDARTIINTPDPRPAPAGQPPRPPINTEITMDGTEGQRPTAA